MVVCGGHLSSSFYLSLKFFVIKNVFGCSSSHLAINSWIPFQSWEWCAYFMLYTPFKSCLICFWCCQSSKLTLQRLRISSLTSVPKHPFTLATAAQAPNAFPAVQSPLRKDYQVSNLRDHRHHPLCESWSICQIAFQKVVPAHVIRDELLGVGINFSTRAGVCYVHHPHFSFVHCSVSPPLLGSWCTSKSLQALWVIKILCRHAAFASHIYPETHLGWKENAGEIEEALTHTTSLRLRRAS